MKPLFTNQDVPQENEHHVKWDHAITMMTTLYSTTLFEEGHKHMPPEDNT